MELRRIQTILYEFDRLRLTDTEYAYLKLITVFNPSNQTGKSMIVKNFHAKTFFSIVECLSSYDRIDAYRMLAYKELNDHINERLRSSIDEEYCTDSERIGRILIKLPLLAELDTNIIEEIFFVGLIGKRFHLVDFNERLLIFFDQVQYKSIKSFRVFYK